MTPLQKIRCQCALVERLPDVEPRLWFLVQFYTREKLKDWFTFLSVKWVMVLDHQESRAAGCTLSFCRTTSGTQPGGVPPGHETGAVLTLKARVGMALLAQSR